MSHFGVTWSTSPESRSMPKVAASEGPDARRSFSIFKWKYLSKVARVENLRSK